MNFNLLTHIRNNDNTSVVWLFNIGIERYWNGEVFTVKNTSDDIIVNHMEEMNLLLTRKQDILILRDYPDTHYLDKMKALGMEIPTILCPASKDENQGIAELVLNDKPLLQDIRDRLREVEQAIFVPYGVSLLEEQIAQELGIPLFGASHELNKRVNNKVFSREFAISHGFRVAEGTVCNGLEALEKNSREYLARFGKIIIKEPCGASGKGLWVVDSESKLKSSLLIIRRFFRDRLEGEWLVEEWCSKQADLNYQVCVGPDGTVEVFSIKEQRVNGTVYIGSVIPVGFSKAQTDECIRCGEIIGNELYKQGYRGILGIDAMILESGELVPIVEINGRFTLSTYVSFIFEKLNLEAGEESSKAKIFASYRKIALKEDDDYNRIMGRLISKGLDYDADAKRGVVVYTSETIKQKRVGSSGRLFTLIMTDDSHLEEDYNRVEEVFN